MSEYTPTTEQVRIAFGYESMFAKQTGEDFAAFDRWLAAHDRVVAAQAWDEGYEVGGHAASGDYSGIYGGSGKEPDNPYRNKESK